MRLQSQDSIKTTDRLNQPHSINIIQQTRKQVRGKNQKQRFQIAKKHLQNALQFKAPRLDTYSQNASHMFKLCYNVQTSYIWRTFLLILSYILMYLVCWETSSATGALITIQSILISILWMDVFMQIYHKSSQSFRLVSKFQLRFYMKILVLIMLLIDLILVYSIQNLQVRPLLVSRCFLPLFYDSNIRKSLQALLMSYKDIIVLIIFYSSIVVVFAIIANQIISLPPNIKVDNLSENYRQLDKTIYIMYDLLTYDAYPDNQLVAIRMSLWYYGFFILYIFLNIFFFSTIPPTLLFNSFRQTRSKIVLVDEIKQQHSLIMSFVSLGQQNLNIDQQKLVRFLLYVYKNKMRYVDHITQVCRKLDENNNRAIHIKQYMHLCKILQAKTTLLPPKFHDWDRWIIFRRIINQTFFIKRIVKSKGFKIANSLLILFCFVNSILALYLKQIVFNVIDDVIIFIFLAELFIKIVGIGLENFFYDPWNKLDFILVMLGLTLQFLPNQFKPHNCDVLIKMTRIFRITTLFKLVSDKAKDNNSLYFKATRLFSQIAIIIPIVIKFFPIYLISLYILGVTGMQIFKQTNINNNDSPFNTYQQYSNFSKFIYSQFLFIQILIQSQWSTIVYDYAFKYKSFILVCLFFVFSHILLVTVLTSLLKGITWEVYNTVHEQFNERTTIYIKNKIKQQNLQKKKDKIQEVKNLANQNQFFIPDNLIAKQIYQKKIDTILFKKLKQNVTFIQNIRQKKRKRSQMISFLFKQHNLAKDQIDDPDCKTSDNQMVCNKDSQFLDLIDIDGDDDLQQQDIEDEMEKVLQKIQLNSKIFYSEATIYPKVLIQYLQFKIKSLKTSFMDDFVIDQEDDYSGDQIKDTFVDGINELLQIQISQRQQKAMILNNMLKEGIITQGLASKALTKKADKDSSIDSNWIMRKAFLSGTNQKLIKKFEIQYFSNVYGKSFKQINKVTIEPLLRLESKLTYCLRNALRYRKTSQQNFFTIISTIQQTISNQLLKKGSLFKFVYQIDSITDTWFTIQLRQSNQLRIRFIKNGIWLYHKSMKDSQIMIAEDFFNCQNISISNIATCQKYVKMLFESCQSLAFSLTNQKSFFKYDPRNNIYDLFTFCKQVQTTQRVKNRSISISKVMLIILSKQDQRQQPLSYPLTDILVEQYESTQKTMSFRLDQTQNQTFQKLKQMELLDHERIIESEGMPFNNIANLMIEIKEIISLHQINFVFQLERFLNNAFNVK